MNRESEIGIELYNNKIDEYLKCDDIIDYRNEYGRFTSAEDLLKIKGIGEATLEKLRPYIVFDDTND